MTAEEPAGATPPAPGGVAGGRQGGTALTARDRGVLTGQLGRPPRDVAGIACRCPFGYPAVIATGPLLAGEPNPTLLYLTCPSVAKAVSRVESSGGVKRFREALRVDGDVRAPLDDLTRLYRARRERFGRAALKTAVAGESPAAPAGARPGAPAAAPAAVRPAVRPGAGIGGPESPEVASCLHAYAAAMLAVFSGWLGGDERQAGGRRAGPAARPAEGAPRSLEAPPASPASPASPAPPAPRGGAETSGEASLAGRLRAVWRRFLPHVEECWCADRTCARWDSGSRVAAIDAGTISVRLLVADVENGRPLTRLRRAEITRLGEGLRPGGLLDAAAQQRTGDVVARFAEEARVAGAESVVLAATSAARDAADGPEFVAWLGRENGLDVAVLSGIREAELAYAGATLDVPGGPVVLDIGGGSTEVMRRRGAAATKGVSLDIGASRATERWLLSDPPTPAEIAAAARGATLAFATVAESLGCIQASGGNTEGRPAAPLVGVAGTVTTLACLDAGLESYDADFLHLRTLTLDSVRQLVRRLSGMTTAERAALPCVQAGRAPVLVGGAVILEAAMEALGYDRLIVSERDILDGLIMRGLGEACS